MFYVLFSAVSTKPTFNKLVGEQQGSIAYPRSGKRSPDFPYPPTKKTSEMPTSEVPPSLHDSTHSPSSRCAPVRSRGSESFGIACRSGFGRPQAITKGGRECRQQQGDERVENAGVTSGTTLFRQSGVPWVPFTNCQKKAEVPPSASSTHCPLHRKKH